MRRNFYGRFKGPSLTKGQETLLKECLPKIIIGSVDLADNPQRKPLNLKNYILKNQTNIFVIITAILIILILKRNGIILMIFVVL